LFTARRRRKAGVGRVREERRLDKAHGVKQVGSCRENPWWRWIPEI